MFTPYESNAIVTELERAQRDIHITVEEYGPPIPTVQGYIVSGVSNTGPIPDPGPRCPLSEWRMITLEAGEEIEEANLSVNEHWLVISGTMLLQVEDIEVELTSEEVALLRTGTRRRIFAQQDVRLIVAREHRQTQGNRILIKSILRK